MIELENVVKRYGKKTAVAGISFRVNQGEIVGLLGANGAGKSTTMNMLTGYLSSSSGKITVDGMDLLEKPVEARKKIGYLPEIPPLYPDMTVNEYLNFVYDLKNCSYPRKQHLEEICEVARITDVRHRVIGHLSKGYRQRVGVAQTLIGNPPVIVLDEPTVGLDPKQVVEMRNLIRTLGREHAVILSSHVLSEVQAVCDRVIILNRGKLVADRKTEEIGNDSNGKRRITLHVSGPQKDVMSALRSLDGVAYVQPMPEHEPDSCCFAVESEPGVDVRKPLFHLMAKNGWPIMGLQSTGANLEDAFLSLISRPDSPSSRKRVQVRVSSSAKKED